MYNLGSVVEGLLEGFTNGHHLFMSHGADKTHQWWGDKTRPWGPAGHDRNQQERAAGGRHNGAVSRQSLRASKAVLTNLGNEINAVFVAWA